MVFNEDDYGRRKSETMWQLTANYSTNLIIVKLGQVSNNTRENPGAKYNFFQLIGSSEISEKLIKKLIL